MTIATELKAIEAFECDCSRVACKTLCNLKRITLNEEGILYTSVGSSFQFATSLAHLDITPEVHAEKGLSYNFFSPLHTCLWLQVKLIKMIV